MSASVSVPSETMPEPLLIDPSLSAYVCLPVHLFWSLFPSICLPSFATPSFHCHPLYIHSQGSTKLRRAIALYRQCHTLSFPFTTHYPPLLHLPIPALATSIPSSLPQISLLFLFSEKHVWWLLRAGDYNPTDYIVRGRWSPSRVAGRKGGGHAATPRATGAAPTSLGVAGRPHPNATPTTRSPGTERSRGNRAARSPRRT